MRAMNVEDMEQRQGLTTERDRDTSFHSRSYVGFCVGTIALCSFALFLGVLIGKDLKSSSPSSSPVPDHMPSVPPHASMDETPVSQVSKRAQALLDAKDLANDKIKELIEYYGVHAEKLLMLSQGGIYYGFTSEGKPTNPENFKRMSDIMARTLANKERFKVGFIGSSVQCGHDNCYYDSFQKQMARFLDPVFEKAVGPLDIRNACQGGGCGDSYLNQPFCFTHMVGTDIDVLFYEWTYYETSSTYQIIHELLVRWLYRLKNQPALFIINVGNAFQFEQVEHYAASGSNAIMMEGGLLQGVYKGREWGAVGDGLHTSTRYGNLPGVSKARKDSLGVVYRNWHPGPLGFQYISDVWSYYLLRVFVDAVERIMDNPNDAEKLWPMENIMTRLSAPEKLSNFFWSKDPLLNALAHLEDEPPYCFTAKKATFGKPLVQISDSQIDPLNPYKESVRKMSSSDDAWTIWNAGPNWGMIPEKERPLGEDMCLAPDHCGYFVEPFNSKAITPLVFRLPKMTIGYVQLCGGPQTNGKSMLERIGVVEFDGKKMDKSKFITKEDFPGALCVILQSKFSGPVEDASGHVYLAIYPGPGAAQISQVIVA